MSRIQTPRVAVWVGKDGAPRTASVHWDGQVYRFATGIRLDLEAVEPIGVLTVFTLDPHDQRVPDTGLRSLPVLGARYEATFNGIRCHATFAGVPIPQVRDEDAEEQAA